MNLCVIIPAIGISIKNIYKPGLVLIRLSLKGGITSSITAGISKLTIAGVRCLLNDWRQHLMYWYLEVCLPLICSA